MAMEIEKGQGVHINDFVKVDNKEVDPKVDRSENNSAKAAAPDNAAAKKDTVVISADAKHIQEVISQLKAVADVDEEKVARLKKEIENGTYEINADKIAGMMIKEGLSYEEEE